METYFSAPRNKVPRPNTPNVRINYMKAYNVLPEASLAGWIKHLQQSFRVVGPKALHGDFVFGEIETADDLSLTYAQTVLPPKKYLIPQREVLFTFDIDQATTEAVIEVEPTVILGVHTCDLHAIRLFDKIFGRGFTDQHYAAYRESLVIVSIECLTPCTEQSFCRSMGTLSAPEIFDLHMVDLGDEYIIEVGSEKGAALLSGFDGVFTTTEDDLQRRYETLRAKWDEFPYRLEADVTELPELLHESFNSEHWQTLGDICLSCGMCTQVCPTCYCFDMVDEVDITLNTGKRVRVWDSCQVNEFAMVAGGHNFRKARAARQRHRFMRKGKYQFDSTGMVGCVGCGRCATACLVDITPIKTFNALYRERQAKLANAEEEA